MTPFVFKFGGSSFLELAAYNRIAEYVAQRLGDEKQGAVIVVSAMSGTTGKLQATLRAVNEDPPPAAASMILPSGESTSAGLFIAALDAAGLSADGLLGNQIGFHTEGPADRATLRSVDATPVLGLLERVRVAVVPGGQAADENGELAMLGRNSSDLTAVALAAAFDCPEVELFSDVPGVCSADPYVVPTAQVLGEVDYVTMELLSTAGAKVIHHQAVEWAQRHNVRIVCRTLPPEAVRTTTVTAGRPCAAVTLHERGDAWTFADEFSRKRAAHKIEAEGLDALPVDLGGKLVLVVNAYGQDVVAARCCADGTLDKDVALLTVLNADGSLTRSIVPRAEGDDQVRRHHAELYPNAGRTVVGIDDKQRSEHSDVLFGEAQA